MYLSIAHTHTHTQTHTQTQTQLKSALLYCFLRLTLQDMQGSSEGAFALSCVMFALMLIALLSFAVYFAVNTYDAVKKTEAPQADAPPDEQQETLAMTARFGTFLPSFHSSSQTEQANTDTHARTHTHTYTYTDTHTHTHTHTHKQGGRDHACFQLACWVFLPSLCILCVCVDVCVDVCAQRSPCWHGVQDAGEAARPRLSTATHARARGC